MDNFPLSLTRLIEKRIADNAFRQLTATGNLLDFSSNDYLGFSKSAVIFEAAHQLLIERGIIQNGATGSRLLSGNHSLYAECETFIAKFHNSPTALLYNSGYDANVGFFSSVPQRNDIILYDELCHASIRDGIKMSNAKSFKFSHNDLDGLHELIVRYRASAEEMYIVTESVFSMDGDSPDIARLIEIAESNKCLCVIDEAHSLGVFGDKGEGLVQSLNLHDKVFARIMTFGKALGCHGAAIVCDFKLLDYLINFSRSFIYTTGLPPHSLAVILCAYKHLESEKHAIEKLRDNILMFNREKNGVGLKQLFVRGKSAIQSAIIPGNDKVKGIAATLQQSGFDIRPILSPTVPQGQERLRICIHSYNSDAEITKILEILTYSLAQSIA